ncbi:porin [Aquabacterium sp.]|uniref:porin n=1 Tax=Aquabacterium sp. TaxID=1872578 RepID=UPI002BD5261F|nr:porin [Aquabacterium sp.]HSW05154.1 porin [Aquabacterium sp.]
MKCILASVGLAGLAIGAQAQTAPASSSVTIYGIADLGVERLTNVGAGGGSLTRMPGLTGSLPSRLGFRGSEDLGDGLKAIFALEMGIGLDAGTHNQGGRGFGRQAFVGLSGPWGSVTLGRNYSMLYWGVFDGDLLGPNAFGIGSLDSYVPNTRVDNSIAYRGTFSGLTVGATYSFGRDAVNAGPSPAGTNCAGENPLDSKACREWSGLLKYDAPAWGVALGVDEIRGGTGAFAGLVRSDLTDRRITLNGYAKLGSQVKLAAGVLRRDNDAAAAASATNGATSRSNIAWFGASWSPAGTLFTLDGQVQRIDFAGGGDKSTLSVIRGFYNLSRRSAVYLQAGHISNGSRLAFGVSSAQAGGAPVAGSSQNGVMAGIRHIF